MSENNHTGRSFHAKGYYIALILCAAAIGISGYVYQSNQKTKEAVLQETVQEQIPVGPVITEEDVPALATESPRQTQPTPVPRETEPAKTQKKLKTASPVSGQEIYSYSMEALSYNQTTRDWRVHDGVDIAAAAGSPVTAAAEGVVDAAYEDDAMGHTVVIRHTGGYTTCYASLAENLQVAAGDPVKLGQTIGYVGSSALVETTLGDHLHFSVTCQDKPMDPAEFMALGQ